MNREPLITYLGCGPDKPVLQGGTEALPLPLRMGTQSLVFWIGFLLGMADISEIVPVARKLTDVTIGAVYKDISDRVETVTCYKGCHSACCRYLLVSLSVPEALAMVGEVNSQDSEMREQTIHSCHTVAGRIRECLAANPALAGGLMGREGILNWYMELDTVCPFHQDRLCLIYDRRPITCRECLVTTPDSYCRKSTGQVVRKVKLPVRFSAVMTQFSKELYGTEDEIIVLPCVFDWFTDNQERYRKTWPTEYLVRRFIEITVSKSSTAPIPIGMIPSSLGRADDRGIRTVK